MNRFWNWWFRFRFRYDVFISYARKDARGYAHRLRDQLKALDYTCFLDVDEAPAGGQLTPTLRSAIRRSAVLVLAGSSEAAASSFVRLEVEAFMATGRDVLPIRFSSAGALPHARSLRDDVIWIDDGPAALASGEPSAVVADTIDRRFKFTRRNVRVRVQVAATAAIFLIGAVVSTWLIARGIRRAETATALAEEQRRVAMEASHQADLQRQQAEKDRDEARRQKEVADAATTTAQQQQVIAEAASARANQEAARAVEQERLAVESANRATEQQARARALYLVEQGLREADRSPLLGLRLALEGWFGVPADDAETRAAIAGRLRELAGSGRVASISVSPQTVTPFFIDRGAIFGASSDPFFIGREATFVTSSAREGAIRRLQDGSVVTPLKGNVISVDALYEPESDADAAAHPESQLLFIKYKDATSEIRDEASGRLIVSGDIERTLGTYGPLFALRFKSNIELRRIDDPDVVVATLPSTSKYLHFDSRVPSLLFVTTDSDELELRSIRNGSVIDRVSGLDSLSTIEVSPNGAFFTLRHRGETYEDSWFELRDARTSAVVKLADKPRHIAFSPKGRGFVVGYRGRPAELQSETSIGALAGELTRCVFNAEGTLFAISYASGPAEIRRVDGAEID